MIKIVCINKKDSDLKYLKTYDAIVSHAEGYGIEYLVFTSSQIVVRRYEPDIMPIEKYRNSQIDKIIAK